MNGRDLQKRIIHEAQKNGWLVAHFASVPTMRRGQVHFATPARADGRGFPDLVLLRERTLVVEVKGRGDTLRADQHKWISAFRTAGIRCEVWGPKDWETGAVTVELERHAPREEVAA